jgi:hypothetical protein
MSSNGFAAAGRGCTKLLLISPATEMPARRFLLLISAGLLACCWREAEAETSLGLTVVKHVAF